MNRVGPATAAAVRGERGSATVEFAMVLPAVLLTLGLCLAGVRLAGLEVLAQDAAADGARLLARGEGTGEVAERVRATLAGATWSRSSGDGLVCVTVRASGGGALALLAVSGRSCALEGGR